MRISTWVLSIYARVRPRALMPLPFPYRECLPKAQRVRASVPILHQYKQNSSTDVIINIASPSPLPLPVVAILDVPCATPPPPPPPPHDPNRVSRFHIPRDDRRGRPSHAGAGRGGECLSISSGNGRLLAAISGAVHAV